MASDTHFPDFKKFIKKNNKIPEYAKEYKREYQFIIGINKEFKYIIDFMENYDNEFKSHKLDRIMKFIKRFLRAQEKGKLKDISDLVLQRDYYCYLEDFYFYYEIEFGNNPSYKEFFDLLGKLYNKIKNEFVFSDYYGEGYCI